MVSCEEKKRKLEIAITQLAKCHRELGEIIKSRPYVMDNITSYNLERLFTNLTRYLFC